MELVKCDDCHLETLAELYRQVVARLIANVNYPKWSREYPCRESIRDCIQKGEQFMCLEEGKLVGAVVLNENPGGRYEAGEWTRSLAPGEYLVIHTLAVAAQFSGMGIGGKMVDSCIEYARKHPYKAVRLDVVPENIPAAHLYKKKGFVFAGTRDLERNIPDIPVFDLYELNL